jgi:hypothetical protein
MQGFGTNCGQPIFSGVTSDADKNTIVDAHNNLRRTVAQGKESRGNPGPQPPAANMRKLVSSTADTYNLHNASEWSFVYYYITCSRTDLHASHDKFRPLSCHTVSFSV